MDFLVESVTAICNKAITFHTTIVSHAGTLAIMGYKFCWIEADPTIHWEYLNIHFIKIAQFTR